MHIITASVPFAMFFNQMFFVFFSKKMQKKKNKTKTKQ